MQQLSSMQLTSITQTRIQQIAEELDASRCLTAAGQRVLPCGEELEACISLIRLLVFADYAYDSGFRDIKAYPNSTEQIISMLVMRLSQQIKLAYQLYDDRDTDAMDTAMMLCGRLSTIREMLHSDVEAAYAGDPAATCHHEIIACYPSITALLHYRVAHELAYLGVPLLPRMISEMAHGQTGIDIHPEARIGSHFFIDHGTGVVIGATAIIGNRVKIYQGVTLGAKSFPVGEDGVPIKGLQRHPIIEDDVIIYANATILGRVTIGWGSKIGANVWVTEDVPAKSILLA